MLRQAANIAKNRVVSFQNKQNLKQLSARAISRLQEIFNSTSSSCDTTGEISVAADSEFEAWARSHFLRGVGRVRVSSMYQ
jgi:hypothetical protein